MDVGGGELGKNMVLILVFGAGTIIAVSITCFVIWSQYRTRVSALNVLRAYAERGEEPPPSVIEALSSVGTAADPGKPAAPPTRGGHLARFTANAVLAVGAAVFVWWRAPDPSDPGLVIVPIIAGLFFAAAAAARLVAAIHMPRDER